LSAAPATPEREPRDYTPRHLADKILQSKSALEGERKQVTVLFADVKGSMELAEKVDPEEWHRILDRFFQILADGVHRFEGTVNQYTGDGIMALFGAPIAHEDHAQRACYAALHLRDQLRGYADELRRRGLNFSVRMGLNSGEVVVGKIGDDLRMDYTAQGHTVGLAQRAEQTAAADAAYVTKYTADLVQGFFQLRDLGAFELRGAAEPLNVYELGGVGGARTRLEVSRARGFSKFVGREGEMQALEAALARSRETAGQVVGVVAEAGVGKSRLCYEFLEGCRARGLSVFEGRAVSHGRNIPFLPMLQVFRAYYGITEQDDDRAVREKIAGRLLLIDEGFREVLPLLFEFFGVTDPERPAPQMDPEASQRQLFAVLQRLVREAGEAEPGVTLLEDLHWMDGGSLGFLEQWVEAIGGARGLLLVNFRPEYHAEWMGKSWTCWGEIRARRAWRRRFTRARRAIPSSRRRWCSRWWSRVSSWVCAGATGWCRIWGSWRSRPRCRRWWRRGSTGWGSGRSRCCRRRRSSGGSSPSRCWRRRRSLGGGCGVSVRAVALPGGGVRVQASLDAGGGLRLAARRAAGAGASIRGERDRKAGGRQARRALGAAGASLGAGGRGPRGSALARPCGGLGEVH
jgi:class 3 adenylate cyclase